MRSQTSAHQPEPAAEPARNLRRVPESTGGNGYLAQLAASITQSPRVQALRAMAEMMNSPAPVAQTKERQEEKRPAEREPLEEEKHPAQTRGKLDEKTTMQGRFEAPPAAGQIEAAAAPSPNRTGLPDRLKSGVESLSGIDLDDIKVHYNSARPAQLNALAYAQGSDIHVAPGQEQHLPHEAWHVVQQAQGRVQPTIQMKNGLPVNDDPHLEREADLMGMKALVSGRGAAGAVAAQRTEPESDGREQPLKFADALASNAPVQRVLDADGYSLPKEERTLDGFLKANNFDAPFACSQSDYDTMNGMHVALLAQIDQNETVEVDSDEGEAYDALVDYAYKHELAEKKELWNAAISAAAAAFEADPGAGDKAAKTLAALAAWPGRAQAPDKFPEAVIAEVAPTRRRARQSH
jgi:hypothetical protein